MLKPKKDEIEADFLNDGLLFSPRHQSLDDYDSQENDDQYEEEEDDLDELEDEDDDE